MIETFYICILLTLCTDMDRNLLKSVIYDQQSLQWNADFIERNISESLISSDEILVITGVRRCGKSTLLQQIRKHLKEKDYYLNFDDERLIQFTVDDFQDLFEVFIELLWKQDIHHRLQCCYAKQGNGNTSDRQVFLL